MTMREYAEWAGIAWWDAVVPAWLVLGLALYGLATGPALRRKLRLDRPSAAHRLAAAGGIAAAAAAMSGPLAAWGHLIGSLHMLQSALLYFVAVPLLMLAVPPRLFAGQLAGQSTMRGAASVQAQSAGEVAEQARKTYGQLAERAGQAEAESGEARQSVGGGAEQAEHAVAGGVAERAEYTAAGQVVERAEQSEVGRVKQPEGRLNRPRAKRSVLSQLAYAALVAFGLLFTLHHVPVYMETVIELPALYYGERVLLLAAAVAMWRPIVAAARHEGGMSKEWIKRYSRMGAVALLPACLLMLLPAISFSRIAQAAWAAGLCAPAMDGLGVVPPWPASWDAWIGSALMMGIHMLAFHLALRERSGGAAANRRDFAAQN